MRYEKGHKEATRQRILEVASRQFREGGIAAVGIAGVMAEAGLTNGAFYAHFASKDELVRDMLGGALDQRREHLPANAEDGAGMEASIRSYLSARHRDQPGAGCPTAALAAEVARQPKATREAFTTRVSDVIGVMAGRLRGGTPSQRRQRALALYGQMIGTLQIARAVSDRRFSDEVLAAGLAAALSLAEGPPAAEVSRPKN